MHRFLSFFSCLMASESKEQARELGLDIRSPVRSSSLCPEAWLCLASLLVPVISEQPLRFSALDQHLHEGEGRV